jgi:predicted phosphodiesterase
MRVHFMSDLHLEFGRHTIDLPTGDVLVLAGDVTVAHSLDATRDDMRSRKTQTRTREFFDHARSNFDHVIYVAGNHEHYHGDIKTTGDILSEHVSSGCVRFVENEAVEVDGVTFLCCTLWSDMCKRDPTSLKQVNRGLQDFSLIASGEERFSALQAADVHDASVSWLRRELNTRQDRPAIIVTHHAPSLQGLAPGFSHNGLDGGFASDLEHIAIEHPNIHSWIFGHTHVRKSFTVGQTIFRANCAGYPGTELHGFDPDTWFEV